MKTTKLLFLFTSHHCISKALFLLLFTLLGNTIWSQITFPITIKNNSEFPDSTLYVAIVGKDLITGKHIWINAVNNQVLPMDKSYNTIPGHTYNNDQGPGGNGLYANCFFRLSNIPNKTFTLPGIIGARVYIAQREQLYFYFHGPTDPGGGYAAPNNQNASDPNRGILYEFIEMANDTHGFFGNSSRVDGFVYPVGIQLYGANGFYQKVGDLKTRTEAVALFRQNVSAAFLGCVNDSNLQISAPSKQKDFFDGSAGTTPGVNADYFKSYIDAIWEKYKNEDLVFNAGNAGVFKGRVMNEQLQLKEINGGFSGKTGTVIRRPTTQEVLEGKGVLNKGLTPETDTVDKVVQAQLTAAINRHVVNITTTNVGRQNWYDTAQFYKAEPMNYYARFWHLPGICVNRLAYGFCYDDVADQSPSIHTTSPDSVILTFGGYAGITCDSTVIVPHLSVNGGALQSVANASVAAGSSIQLAPQPATGNWYWTGPNGFSAAAATISLANIQTAQGGIYTAAYHNACGSISTVVFQISVSGSSTPATGGCSGTGPNEPGTAVPDYTWQAAGSANPVITFTPGTPITGSTLALLYVKNSSGGYDGYGMDASGSAFTKSIPAASGTPLIFYFTYRVGNTGVERNSSAAPHTFTVGHCGSTSSNTPPAVTIALPGGTAYYAPATVTIRATASDGDGTISKVAFYNGSTKIGESTTSPYSYTWTGVAAGTYPLTAVATDNGGAATTSTVINITVTGNSNTSSCTGNGPIAAGQTVPDYSYQIVANGNVKVTFVPGTPISSCDLAIFYYHMGAGSWMGYLMTPSGGRFLASVPIASGSAIRFYFTYRRSAGGPESNSSAVPHSYTVGDNCGAGVRMESSLLTANQFNVLATENQVSTNNLYPNPATARLVLPIAGKTKSNIVVLDISGRIMAVKMPDNRTIDISALPVGMYTVIISGDAQIVVKKFLKK